MANILIVLFESAVAEKIACGVVSRGHGAQIVNDISALRALWLNPWDLAVLNFPPGGGDLLAFLRDNPRPAENPPPILGATAENSLGVMETLFHAGVTECVPRPFRLGDLLDKVERLLTTGGGDDNVLSCAGVVSSVPKLLHQRVETVRAEARALGDIAEIFGGVAAHDGKGRRMSAPSPEWQAVLNERSVEPFYVNEEREFYLFNRTMVNRVPEKHEYLVPEKVLLRRMVSPLAAALDTSRLPFNSGLWGIVTARGLEPGYLVCVLNSRFANFYWQRYRPAGNGMRDMYFSRHDLEVLPVMIAQPREQAVLASLAREAARISPDTRTAEKKIERGRLLAEINRRILEIYGFTEEEVHLLGELHY